MLAECQTTLAYGAVQLKEMECNCRQLRCILHTGQTPGEKKGEKRVIITMYVLDEKEHTPDIYHT